MAWEGKYTHMYEIVGRRQGCISLNHQDYELGKKTAVRLHMIFFQISAFFCEKITHVPCCARISVSISSCWILRSWVVCTISWANIIRITAPVYLLNCVLEILHYDLVCVFFALSRFLSSRQDPAHPVSVPILRPSSTTVSLAGFWYRNAGGSLSCVPLELCHLDVALLGWLLFLEAALRRKNYARTVLCVCFEKFYFELIDPAILSNLHNLPSKYQ